MNNDEFWKELVSHSRDWREWEVLLDGRVFQRPDGLTVLNNPNGPVVFKLGENKARMAWVNHGEIRGTFTVQMASGLVLETEKTFGHIGEMIEAVEFNG